MKEPIDNHPTLEARSGFFISHYVGTIPIPDACHARAAWVHRVAHVTFGLLKRGGQSVVLADFQVGDHVTVKWGAIEQAHLIKVGVEKCGDGLDKQNKSVYFNCGLI